MSKTNKMCVLYDEHGQFIQYYGFPAAILDFWLKETSEKDGMGTVEKLAPENIGVAVGILFLSRMELEKSVGGNFTPPPRWLQTGVKNRWIYEG